MNIQLIAIVGAVCIAIGSAGGYKFGASVYENKLLNMKDEYHQARQAMRDRLLKQEREKQILSDALSSASAKVITETVVVTEEIEKEVIKYVQTDPTSCTAPEWLRLHNTAAASRVPKDADTSGTSD